MLTSEDLQQIGQITTKIVKEELKEGLKPLTEKVEGLERSIDDLAESVAFIKDNAVTKQELGVQLSSLEHRLDQKIDGVEKRLDAKIGEAINHIDGFAKKQEKFDHELVSMKDRQDRFEKTQGKIVTHLQLDPRTL